MKIFSSEQIRDIDSYTIANEPIASVDLMERASNAIFEWMAQNLSFTNRFVFICGPGNNGGDGLAVARMMFFAGFNVSVYYIDSTTYSSDFTINLSRLKKTNVYLKIIIGESDFPLLNHNDIIVDALYGSGLSRPIEGLVAKLVQHINQSIAKVVAIDIPSGLFNIENPYPNTNTVVKADACLTLQFPKLSFFFAENEMCVGQWSVLPIGLHPTVIDEKSTPYYYLENTDVLAILKPRTIFSHKGTFGHCLVIGGSYGMMGAAALCAKAAVKSGSGLVTMHVPKCGYTIAQQLVPMAMCTVDTNENFIASISNIDKYSSICIGPGLGTNPQTVKVLEDIIVKANVPLVLDADALNAMADDRTLLSMLGRHVVLTPHPKEMDRLLGIESASSYDRHLRTTEFAVKHDCTVVLKGAYTAICTADGKTYFNPTGNPGMAKGGSGDVLTGLLVGVLAQGYEVLNSSMLSVYMHGLAGDFAAARFGQDAMRPSDLVDHLPEAWQQIRRG